MNVARISSLRAGIPVEASAVTINRFCSSGLQAIAYGAERIMLGQGRAAVAGGTESMSMVPMGGNKISPNPSLVSSYPDVYLSTGLVAENHARESTVSRAEQDEFALRSHQRAIAAMDAGRFDAELAPVTVRDAKGRETVVALDEGPRRDSTIEALARLKPVFPLPEGEDREAATGGTATAGNVPGITDGGAATVLASERTVERYGLKPLARIVGYAQADVEPKWLFLAPIQGVRRLLDRIEMPIEAFDLIEINEAFAAQVVADGRELGFDWEKVNVNGGAIALGHPVGASGARIVATLLHELKRREGRYGLATLCLGGGGAVAMAFERV
jgi:acetyl-CoA acyltransferase